MNLKNKKSITNLIYILTILLSTIFIFVGYRMNKTEHFLDENAENSYAAKVIYVDDEIKEKQEYGNEIIENITIKFYAKIINGDIKNQEIEGFQYIDGIVEVNPKKIEKGDNIIVSLIQSRTSEGKVWTFIEYNRINQMITILICFVVFLILIGHKKGIRSIISLIFTVLSIFLVFIPSIIKGNNIYISTVIISVFIIFMNLLIINGANKKTFCAIVGNLGGFFVSGLLAIFISKALNLTGLIDQDSMFLIMINPDKPIDLIAVLWGSIVIGSLGAVMDVSMSIASALNELALNMENRKFKTFLKSGINIGQDAIGTMTNTLILAYIGSSLSVVLLLYVYYKDILLLFNLEMIVFEILQAIIGSMGILFTVPITSIFSAYIFSK
ncbi:MAG: YibE/F family protein [Tissierellia bacterium]|nr:YibE/F family protein [Tissierellia bacterium]MDD4780077.1 YibE/F family protein [Tissierellia bacterium]